MIADIKHQLCDPAGKAEQPGLQQGVTSLDVLSMAAQQEAGRLMDASRANWAAQARAGVGSSNNARRRE